MSWWDPFDWFTRKKACYRNTFNGFYRTFSEGEIVIPSNEWTLVHPGACQLCEGRFVLDCQEPGDRDNNP